MDDVFRAADAKENNLEESRETCRAPVKEAMSKSAIASLLSSSYDLDVDMDEVFNTTSKNGEISKDEMTHFLVEDATTAPVASFSN